jgi:hypothetical protein
MTHAVSFVLALSPNVIGGAMRWIRHGDAGMAAAPNEAVRWGLMSWTKWGMIQERRTE